MPTLRPLGLPKWLTRAAVGKRTLVADITWGAAQPGQRAEQYRIGACPASSSGRPIEPDLEPNHATAKIGNHFGPGGHRVGRGGSILRFGVWQGTIHYRQDRVDQSNRSWLRT